MGKVKDVVKSYIVASDFNGLTAYLSTMGAWARSTYVYMWDHDVHNARTFDTMKDAKKHAVIALPQLDYSKKTYSILTQFVHKSGKVEIGAIKQYKLKP